MVPSRIRSILSVTRRALVPSRSVPLLLVTLLLASLVVGCAADPGRHPAQGLGSGANPEAVIGMVSSAHEIATRAGVEILEAGGNAFDAAVSVAATLTVAEPMNSNLMGGYGSIVLWDSATEEVRYLDMNGRFPAAVDADVFRAAPSPEDRMRTAAAVSTPGNLHGFEALWKRYGTMDWPALLAPAVRTAEAGHRINAPTARALESNWRHFSAYSRSIFGREVNGELEPLGAGDLLVQADLASSLREVAAEGAEALHGGALGEAVEAQMIADGGFLRLSDLEAHDSDWLAPVSIDYRGVRVFTAGSPSNSFAALVCLGIMNRFDNASVGPDDPDYWHRFAEATKHAFWARLRWAGGPEVDPPPFDVLLSEAYWQERADALSMTRASQFDPPAVGAAEGESTTHFVVADRSGNVVSATLTLGHGFGSAVMVEGTGIWLNNSLAYSTYFPPGNPMDALPGHRKHSSKTPMILVRDGRPWVAIGSPGGHTIPQQMAQLVIDLVDFELDLEDALALPRVAFAEPDLLLVEDGMSDGLVSELEGRGHRVVRRGIGLAHALELQWDGQGALVGLVGAADPRGAGLALAAER